MVTEQSLAHFTDPMPGYQKGLNAKTLEVLRAHVRSYEFVAGTAMDAVAAFTETDFKAFKKALWHERRGQFMGDELAKRFALVLLPEPMFDIDIIAQQLFAPWGLCYRRLVDVGRLTTRGGRAILIARDDDVPSNPSS